jgi:hypothetical protein
VRRHPLEALTRLSCHGTQYWTDVVAGKGTVHPCNTPEMSLVYFGNTMSFLFMTRTNHQKTFNAHLRTGVPNEMAEAIASAAGERLESASDYVRRAVLAQLRQDGFTLPPRDGRAAAA